MSQATTTTIRRSSLYMYVYYRCQVLRACLDLLDQNVMDISAVTFSSFYLFFFWVAGHRHNLIELCLGLCVAVVTGHVVVSSFLFHLVTTHVLHLWSLLLAHLPAPL